MDQVAERKSIETSLHIAEVLWQSLPEVEAEYDDLDYEDLLPYTLEWPVEEQRLEHLESEYKAGAMTEAQATRYRALLRVVEQNRPIVKRIQAR